MAQQRPVVRVLSASCRAVELSPGVRVEEGLEELGAAVGERRWSGEGCRMRPAGHSWAATWRLGF